MAEHEPFYTGRIASSGRRSLLQSLPVTVTEEDHEVHADSHARVDSSSHSHEEGARNNPDPDANAEYLVRRSDSGDPSKFMSWCAIFGRLSLVSLAPQKNEDLCSEG
jgi:hypothetical protein